MALQVVVDGLRAVQLAEVEVVLHLEGPDVAVEVVRAVVAEVVQVVLHRPDVVLVVVRFGMGPFRLQQPVECRYLD